MAYYSPALPLTRDKVNGYRLTSTLKEVIKQNFKMLILTNPGERIMNPDFGVGLYGFLFENFGSELEIKITSKIMEQKNKYMPFLEIKQIEFKEGEDEFGTQVSNTLYVKIEYYTKAVGERDVLEVSVSA